MDTLDIESGPTPAVKNLLSKFESLAVDNAAPASHRKSLQVPTPLSPVRAPVSAVMPAVSPDFRTVSPSSSLKSSTNEANISTKRPPPPPPTTASRSRLSPSPSPSVSPLLRPVPIPAVLNGSVNSAPQHEPSLNVPAIEGGQEEVLPTFGVSALRSRFLNATSNTTSRPFSYSPKPSISSMTDQPSDPPRIHTPSEPLISFESPEDYHSHSSSSNSVSDLDDPFTEDTTESSTDDPDSSTTAVAPPLPARKHHRYHHQQESNSNSSRTSSESDSSQLFAYKGSASSSQSSIPLPRPPPRPRALVLPEPQVPVSDSNCISAPPPLPVRRSTVAQAEDLAASPKTPRPSTSARLAPPPPHSSHPSPNHLARVSLDLDHPPSSAPTTSERKTFGKHPPPPTRTIALGDKLPPKRPNTIEGVTIGDSDDDESGDEDDVKGSGVDLLPDATRASRRPPYLMTPRDRDSGVYPAQPCKITVPAHAGHLAMSGEHVIVGSTHHIRFYNINLSQELPSKSMDTKDYGIKDGKVTAVEFKTEFLVWIALKEGHIFEIDVRNGDLLGVKHCAHMNPILYLFRYAGSMISIDEVGKVLIWSPDPATGDIKLLHHTPRVMRITDKLDFAKIIGGVLWTAGRSEQHGAGTFARTPIIRLYDLFNPASTGKTVMPTEHVGPLTSATIIPSDPGHVYVGHEEGFITIWALEDAESSGGYPKCIEVMKVASTDVTSLEGINDRLWAGGRNGMITVYDIVPRPWMATNSWAAHPGLPVLQISADPFGVEKYKRLGVVSVGRDERVGLWDGLLALDWQDTEVQKHEQSYSTFRDLKVLIISWNCDSAKPDSLHGHPANINFFHDVLNSIDRPDIISFGFQEVIDLESRKMAAKNMLMAARNDARSRRDEGTLLGLSDKVTGAYKRWFDALMLAVKLAMPPDCPYSVVHTESMVGLFTCVMVKNTEKAAVRDVAINTVKRGMGGRYGNKGGILSRFLIDDSSLCFVNCHLAAGQHAVRARNADAAGMLEQQFLFPAAGEHLAFVGGGDGSMVLDHEIVFVNGDMNYRIDQRRDAITAAVRANEHESLFAHDQLLKEIKYNRGCRFRFFTEGPIAFAPTYKYDRRSDVYDTSEKRRAPAWCDRVLWRSRVPFRVKQLHYQRYEVNVSDHRPISAAFNITVKRTRHEIREKRKAEVQMQWTVLQEKLLMEAREFYINSCRI
ncbi:Endonuclease/exonuclease/phosphatase [Lentinula boryana]|uniref:Endonuclease/exonuclease/phosphatase n=1 Tax=Lentinula boryana TaxID=40481 RepID=A0ABQ8PXH4_9AGAR|nr:Endonuclease/exonuclease/phosphatase [Lentinula boryana]